MSEIEKTCENCKYDIEDVDGEHCWRCINNAVEMFEPKERELDIQAIRNKAIDDFVKELKDSLINNYRHLLTIDTDGFEWLTTDSVYTHIDEIAQQLKDGDVDG